VGWKESFPPSSPGVYPLRSLGSARLLSGFPGVLFSPPSQARPGMCPAHPISAVFHHVSFPTRSVPCAHHPLGLGLFSSSLAQQTRFLFFLFTPSLNRDSLLSPEVCKRFLSFAFAPPDRAPCYLGHVDSFWIPPLPPQSPLRSTGLCA